MGWSNKVVLSFGNIQVSGNFIGAYNFEIAIGKFGIENQKNKTKTSNNWKQI